MSASVIDSPTLRQIFQILGVVQEEDPRLLPLARWLLAVSQIAVAHLEEISPEDDELRQLYLLLKAKAPQLAPFIARIADRNPSLETISTEILLDLLCANTGWNHPSEVSKHPPLEALLNACQLRLRYPREPRQRLIAVRERLQHALRLAEKAKERRQRQEQENGT